MRANGPRACLLTYKGRRMWTRLSTIKRPYSGLSVAIKSWMTVQKVYPEPLRMSTKCGRNRLIATEFRRVCAATTRRVCAVVTGSNGPPVTGVGEFRRAFRLGKVCGQPRRSF